MYHIIYNLSMTLLIFIMFISKTNAEGFDFRGLKLGLTLNEVNGLKSVKLNYMPKLVKNSKYSGFGYIPCLQGSVAKSSFENWTYDLLIKEVQERVVVGGCSEFPSRSSLLLFCSAGYKKAPATICDSRIDDRDKTFKVNTELGDFSNITLKFWNDNLINISVSYRVNDEWSRNFHKQLKLKFTKNKSAKEIETKRDDVTLFYRKNYLGGDTGERARFIELTTEKGILGGWFPKVWHSNFTLYNLKGQRLINTFGDKHFGKNNYRKKPIDKQTQKNKEKFDKAFQRRIEQKKKLDKEFLN